MLLLAGGITLYLQPSVPALFAATLVTGAAIAVGNVLLPGVIKRDFVSRAGLMTGLYSMVLSAGAALAAGLTIPLRTATGLGWRDVLALWAVPAILAAAVCAPRALRPGPRPAHASGATAAPRLGALWHDPVAWAVTVFMGLQSLGYYALLAWLPTLFHDHHMAAGQAGWMLSFSSFPAMVAALATQAIERRLRRPQAAVVAAVLLCAIGYLGLLADPVPLSYLWMTALARPGRGDQSCSRLHRRPLPGPRAHWAAVHHGAGHWLPDRLPRPARPGPAALGDRQLDRTHTRAYRSPHGRAGRRPAGQPESARSRPASVIWTRHLTADY
jgi:CP family cyanate transporter-like MFS transporter